MEYEIYRIDELRHHGIKGMRWGIRRYQNKDGSLTAAGKKRKAKLESKLDKLGGKSENEAATRKKSISDLSDDELVQYTHRMTLEKDYRVAQSKLAEVTPKQISKGEKIANMLMDNVVKPAASTYCKKIADKMFEKMFGKKSGETLESLEETRKKLEEKAKIDKYLHPDKYVSEEDKNKRQQREFDAENREAQRQGYKDVADRAAAERARAEKEAADKQAQKEARKEAAKAANERARTDGAHNRFVKNTVGEKDVRKPSWERTADRLNSKIDWDTDERAKSDSARDRFIKNTVDERGSRKSSWERTADRVASKIDWDADTDSYDNINWTAYKKQKPPIIDVYDSEPIRDVPTTTRRSGESYVTYLLEESNRKK